MNFAYLALAILLALNLLFWWVRDRERESVRRMDNCPHPPEQQKTIRVNSILHPGATGLVLPGKRWLKKHCLACGWQRNKYSPSLQPWDEYVAEWRQETIDRHAEYAAREHEHEQALEYAERARQYKRDKEMKRDRKTR